MTDQLDRPDGYYGCSLPPGACGCPQDVRHKCTSAHWIATPPTHDGAEGACPNCGSTAPDHSFGCFRASPKPAPDAPDHTDLMVNPESIDAFMEKNPLPVPDAMRESIADLQSSLDWRGADGIGHSKIVMQRERAETLLAALTISHLRLAQLQETTRQCRKAWIDPNSVAFCRDPKITGLAEVLDVFAAAPSPAVAAEPVASEHGIECRLCGETLHDNESCAHFDCPSGQRVVTSPPVRGDREALTCVSRLNACADFANKSPDTKTYLNDPARELLKEAARLLSLPVQSGAGERGSGAAEADRYFEMAGEFGNQLQTLAGVVQDAIDFLAERKHGNAARSPGHNARVILETALKNVSPSALLSRQAPHSSSEKE